MKNTTIIGFIFVLILLGAIIYPNITGEAIIKEKEIEVGFTEEVSFYKSLTCGCCDIHSDYLSTKGKLNVKENTISDSELSKIKSDYEIPQELQTCHTAVFGNYIVEGHVPLEAIEKLIKEQPDILGISLPGMPTGSPGMPGRKMGDFVVYAINYDRSYEEFMRI